MLEDARPLTCTESKRDIPSQTTRCASAEIVRHEVPIVVARRGHAKNLGDLRMLGFARARAEDMIVVAGMGVAVGRGIY